MALRKLKTCSDMTVSRAYVQKRHLFTRVSQTKKIRGIDSKVLQEVKQKTFILIKERKKGYISLKTTQGQQKTAMSDPIFF